MPPEQEVRGWGGEESCCGPLNADSSASSHQPPPPTVAKPMGARRVQKGLRGAVLNPGDSLKEADSLDGKVSYLPTDQRQGKGQRGPQEGRDLSILHSFIHTGDVHSNKHLMSTSPVYECACVLGCLSRVRLFVTLWTIAHQAPLSMGILQARILECPSPGDLPDPGMEPSPLMSPALAGGFFTTSATWKPCLRASLSKQSYSRHS